MAVASANTRKGIERRAPQAGDPAGSPVISNTRKGIERSLALDEWSRAVSAAKYPQGN